jgi:putative redox protein
MAVEIHLRYEGDLRCTAEHGPSRAALTTDAPTDNGGKGSAFSPTDLVATALGTCMATLMGLAARRDGYDLPGLRVRVVKEMTSVPRRRIGALTVRVEVPATREFSPAERRRLEQAALTCPVRESLHADTKVTTEFVWPS